MARSIQQRGHHMTCALIGMSHKLAAYNCRSSLALWTTREYELVDANEVCQGIQKVRVEPTTRSAVATCKIKENYKFHWWNKVLYYYKMIMCIIIHSTQHELTSNSNTSNPSHIRHHVSHCILPRTSYTVASLSGERTGRSCGQSLWYSAII